MASKDIEKYRGSVEIFQGHSICETKSREIQAEFGFSTGLLHLGDITEFGYNRHAGFMWIKQKKKTEYRFKQIRITVSYDTETTVFIEYRKMSKIIGIKAKELILMWIKVSDMYISDPSSGKISFKTYTGLGRTFPIFGFLLEGEEEKKNEGK